MTPESPRRAAAPTPAAGGEHIRPEWVEAAAKVFDPLAWEDGFWVSLVARQVTQARAQEEVAEILAVVVPAIQAQALRDAAGAMTLRLAPIRDVHACLAGADRWLMDRADRIERGELL